MITNLSKTFTTKCDWQKGNTVLFSISRALCSEKRNIATPVEEKLLRPAGGLTYCISAGWERTSNLTLLLPGRELGASGNNSFSHCWSRQCAWYWKPTALRVSNLQRKQFRSNVHSSDHCVHLVVNS